jgi:hypothetical protein
MVERDNEPPSPGASGGLSAEEADRLAERFRPSWEKDEGTASSKPHRAAKQTLIGIAPPSSVPPPPPPPAPSTSVAPIPPRTNHVGSALALSSKPPPAAPPRPTMKSSHPDRGIDKPTPRGRPVGKQTLIGIAPIVDVSAQKAASPRSDLPPPPPVPAELEARPSAPPAHPSAPPARPTPPPPQASARAADPSPPPVTLEVAKPPASEPPRGIVAPYQPKDDPSGPAVVLNDDVLAMEEARAAKEELLREHDATSRRVPTVMNLKAPASAYPPPPFARKRNKAPFVVGVVVAALAAGVVVALASSSKTQESPVPASSPSALATVSAVPTEPTVAETPPLPQEAPPTTPESEKPIRAAAPKKAAPKKAAPKPPAKAAPKPASTTTSPAPKKSGVIVRESPF